MSKKSELLDTMNENFQEALKSGNEEAYLKLSSALDKMRKELRGYAQKSTLPEMKVVLEKLKDEVPLSDEDLEHLKSWIVGDAQHHIETEKNFDKWNKEMQDTIKVISELWSDHPDPERLLKLKTLTQDASKLVGHVAFFIKQRESVKKFNAAIQEIGESERMILMSLLEQKISTSSF